MSISSSASAKAKAIFIAACATFAMGGAVAGSNIGTTPITRAHDPIGTLPRHAMAAVSADAARAMEGPRDHYDLHTPGGRIPVEELVWHGRMRDTQLAREQLAADYYVDDPAYEDLDYDTYISRTQAPASDRADIQPNPEIARNSAAQPAHRDTAAPTSAASAAPALEGSARHIDVAAALADRAS